MLSGISQKWLSVLEDPELQTIAKEISEEKYTPPIDKWFEFARLTRFEDIKVIVIGQDPYPTVIGDKCVAHGLAFSSLVSLPPSLKNIFECLDQHGLLNKNNKETLTGDLTKWAEEGVLLINTAFTTKVGCPNAHSGVWKEYFGRMMGRLLKRLNKEPIFLLWGANARNTASHFNGVKMIWAHPSPLAQSSLPDDKKFVKCNHFNLANDILVKRGQEKIDWDPRRKYDILSNQDINVSMDAKDIECNVAFTDGSCAPNNSSKESRGGFSVLFAFGEFKNIVVKGALSVDKYPATNNRAEGMAILSAMKYVIQNDDKHIPCVIYTDSELWVNMVTKFVPKWKKEDFDKHANPTLVRAVWQAAQTLVKTRPLYVSHVKGHQKLSEHIKDLKDPKYRAFLNNVVDNLAKRARKMEPKTMVVTRLKKLEWK